jgi:hypothetical protein
MFFGFYLEAGVRKYYSFYFLLPRSKKYLLFYIIISYLFVI